MNISWKGLLYEETRKDYYRSILRTVHEERSANIIFPEDKDVFRAFKLTSLDRVRVVILGQDPYHGVGQAHGLAFSVRKGVKIPPSLRNIFTEIRNDVSPGFYPKHGDLSSWAKQGVLLLNTYLTVRKGKPMSHSRLGWDIFTDEVVSLIDKEIGDRCVYLLWGSKARIKASLIRRGFILKAGHPSFYSASSFFNCKHFSKTNRYLDKKGLEGIDWASL